jgi:hypothetical protein
LIDERGFAVIDVGDDGDVAKMIHVVCGIPWAGLVLPFILVLSGATTVEK